MLYIVSTPIGNLRDITLRALDTLKEVDAIICEDTRQTQKLLTYHQIVSRGGVTPPLLSYHEHSGLTRLNEIMKRLESGESLALVSDSGMPVISDPGFEIVRACVSKNIPVTCLPGPYAAITALAVSCLPVDSYSFFGFLPSKSSGRRKLLAGIQERQETLIFYESPYRLLKSLSDLKEVLGDREAVVARELTKKFEEVVRGNLSDLIETFSKKKILGEIVILVAGKGRKSTLT